MSECAHSCGEGSEEVGPPRRCSRPAEERDSDGDACGSYSALRLLINCFLSDAQGRRALLIASPHRQYVRSLDPLGLKPSRRSLCLVSC